jgi:Pyruvate/2-oxoacid:ferredoxin oxidoreductase gamma subunit
MVAIGAMIVGLNVLTLADLETALNNHMPGRHKQLLPKNVEALKKGAEYALQAVK